MSDIKVCDKCKYSNPQNLIKGIVWCNYWNYCFDHMDKCGNYESKEAENDNS